MTEMGLAYFMLEHIIGIHTMFMTFKLSFTRQYRDAIQISWEKLNYGGIRIPIIMKMRKVR